MPENAEPTAASIYIAHLDDEIPTYRVGSTQAQRGLRAVLNYHALVGDRVIVSANNILLNDALWSILDAEVDDAGYLGYLSDGTLVPILQDTSFTELANRLLRDDAHGLPGQEPAESARVLRVRAGRLDSSCRAMLRRRADVYQEFTAAMRDRLRDDALTAALGLEDRAEWILDDVEERRAQRNWASYGQSLFDECADSFRSEAPNQAEMLRRLSAVIRHCVEAELHYVRPGYPADFRAAVVGVHNLDPVRVTARGNVGVWKVVDRSDVPFGNANRLADVSPASIRKIRASREGAAFHARARAAFTETTAERQASAFFRALEQFQPLVNDVIDEERFGNRDLVEHLETRSARWHAISSGGGRFVVGLEWADFFSAAAGALLSGSPLLAFFAFGARRLLVSAASRLAEAAERERAEAAAAARAHRLYDEVVASNSSVLSDD